MLGRVRTTTMKIAVLCSGYLRSFKTTIVQLKKCLLDQYDCDLYLYTISNEYEHDHYVNQREQFDTIIKHLCPKVYIMEPGQNHETVPQRIKQMWYKIQALNQLRKSMEERDELRYDRVIRVRPDMFMMLDETTISTMIECSENTIIIPNHSCASYPDLHLDNHEGYNDQFAIGPSGLMDIYCDTYHNIHSMNQIGIINSSSLLKAQLDTHKVLVYQVPIAYKLLLRENSIITIAGDSAAGKTTFGRKLQQYIATNVQDVSCLLYECDRYHKWERGHQEWKHITHLHPEANRLDQMKDDIIQLKADVSVSQVDYDHHTGHFTSSNIIHPSQVVIVCGLHTLHDATLNYISDFKIYLDTCDDIKLEWKVKRDSQERGYSREQILASIQARNDDREQFIVPQQQQADIVVKVLDQDASKYSVFIKQQQQQHLMNFEQLLELIVKLIQL